MASAHCRVQPCPWVVAGGYLTNCKSTPSLAPCTSPAQANSTAGFTREVLNVPSDNTTLRDRTTLSV